MGKRMQAFSYSYVHSPYKNENEKVNSHKRRGRGRGLLNDVTNTQIRLHGKGDAGIYLTPPLGRVSVAQEKSVRSQMLYLFGCG